MCNSSLLYVKGRVIIHIILDNSLLKSGLCVLHDSKTQLVQIYGLALHKEHRTMFLEEYFIDVRTNIYLVD